MQVMEPSRYVPSARGFEPTVHILNANHEFGVVPEAMEQVKPMVIAPRKTYSLLAQRSNDVITVSERNSQYSNQQQSAVTMSESIDLTLPMGNSESAGEDRDVAHFDTSHISSNENAYYLGSPASMVQEPLSPYAHVSPTDQDMVDCESDHYLFRTSQSCECCSCYKSGRERSGS